MHAARREMSAELFIHTGIGYTDRNNLGVLASRYSNANFFIEIGKHVTDIRGAKRNPVCLQGMSGGPVFHLGDRGNYNTMREGRDFKPLLEGIIIERPADANVIVAVSIGAIVQTLDTYQLW
jgi:hypothetical protein